MLRIGLDFHGVIDKNPGLYRALSHLLVNNGHEVHIITGIPFMHLDMDWLTKWDIKYTHFFSVVDHHESKGTPIQYDEEGESPKIDPYLWDKTKAEYCAEKDINLHLDDSEVYGMFFSTPYAQIKMLRMGYGRK